MTASGGAKELAEKRPGLATRALRKLWRLAVDRPYRNLIWLHLVRRKGSFQPFNDTRPNRYPRIFRFVQSEIGADDPLAILSYGCSTGEEVFSLRDYFPHASIKGIDINPGNIAACRRRLRKAPDAGIAFETARSTRAEPTAFYDAIFAMGVLRHGSLGQPGVTRCDHLIRFEDFARAIDDFKRCLKPGGLLIVRGSNFRVCDTASGAAFATIFSAGFQTKGPPLFGPDNRLMPGIEDTDAVFRKISG
jgi:SAM-dependent methyltransferase